MGEQLSLVTTLHKSTKRNYLERMLNEKVMCMKIAKKYGQEYWDGDRKYGYGGYKYIPDRWEPMALKLIQRYNLTNKSKVLDIGCGKSYLLYEIQRKLPEIEIFGFDISSYALANQHPNFKGKTFIHKAQDKYPFDDHYFDLAISMGTFHNLKIYELKDALYEMNRVSKNSYLMVESYRDELELFNLECWALTAESLLDVEEWEFIFKEYGYAGDYEFIFFE